jgi:uncharacterized membrane protein
VKWNGSETSASQRLVSLVRPDGVTSRPGIPLSSSQAGLLHPGYGIYAAMFRVRPAAHPMSFLVATMGIGSLMILPFYLWEIAQGGRIEGGPQALLAMAYMAVLPSFIAYLFFNRGIELIGAARAGQSWHLMPVFGSVLAVLFLGETLYPYHAIGIVLIAAGIVLAADAAFAVPGEITHLSGAVIARRADGQSRILSVKSEIQEGDHLAPTPVAALAAKMLQEAVRHAGDDAQLMPDAGTREAGGESGRLAADERIGAALHDEAGRQRRNRREQWANQRIGNN